MLHTTYPTDPPMLRASRLFKAGKRLGASGRQHRATGRGTETRQHPGGGAAAAVGQSSGVASGRAVGRASRATV